MKYKILSLGIALLFIGVCFHCGGSSGSSGSDGDDSSVPDPFSSATATGDVISITVGLETVKVIYANNSSTDIVFPFGIANDYTETISGRFFISETEVTYDLWHTVYTWATDAARGANQYYFSNAGTMGDGTGDNSLHPVTQINWRDAMVWCNAFTEWYNALEGTGYECVYYSDSEYTVPIRDSRDGSYGSSVNSTLGSFDNPYVKTAAKGFRLPTINEWEYSARYLGKTVPSTGDDIDSDYVSLGHNDDSIPESLTSGYYWTPGNYASGATADYSDTTATGLVAWYNGNSGSSTHEIKGKTANTLGFRDMSGNVWEWCFDLSGLKRAQKGGSWSNSASDLRVASWRYYEPYTEISNTGFRFTKMK